MATIPRERMEALIRERILSDHPEEAVAALRIPDRTNAELLLERLLERNGDCEIVEPYSFQDCRTVQKRDDIEILSEDLAGTGLAWRLLPSLVTAGYVTEYTEARLVVSPHPKTGG